MVSAITEEKVVTIVEIKVQKLTKFLLETIKFFQKKAPRGRGCNDFLGRQLYAFENRRNALTKTYTHGGNTKIGVFAFHQSK